MPRKITVANGLRFGKLLVIGNTYSVLQGKTLYICQCDCGVTVELRSYDLKSGRRKSCGCTSRQHGKTGTPTNLIWQGIRSRCNNPNVRSYKNYGGRGISVCNRWDSFENFLEDMGERPSGMQIDRIDNNGNYEPANCRWVTNYENQQNKGR